MQDTAGKPNQPLRFPEIAQAAIKERVPKKKEKKKKDWQLEAKFKSDVFVHARTRHEMKNYCRRWADAFLCARIDFVHSITSVPI